MAFWFSADCVLYISTSDRKEEIRRTVTNANVPLSDENALTI